MPIKQNLKGGLAEPLLPNNGEVKKAGLFIVDSLGNIDKQRSYGTFLLNPSTFEESKSSNWVQHSIPGQSDPVFQWVSSGARTITFDALVTKDKSNVSSTDTSASTIASNSAVKESIWARLAARVAQVKEISLKTSDGFDVADNLSIEDYLNYYRSLLYPKYKEGNGRRSLAESPPRLVLLSGNTITSTPYDVKITNKNTTWVLTELKIKTTKMLPNLSPMEAIVSFTLVQYNAESSSSEDFSTSSKTSTKV